MTDPIEDYTPARAEKLTETLRICAALKIDPQWLPQDVLFGDGRLTLESLGRAAAAAAELKAEFGATLAAVKSAEPWWRAREAWTALPDDERAAALTALGIGEVDVLAFGLGWARAEPVGVAGWQSCEAGPGRLVLPVWVGDQAGILADLLTLPADPAEPVRFLTGAAEGGVIGPNNALLDPPAPPETTIYGDLRAWLRGWRGMAEAFRGEAGIELAAGEHGICFLDPARADWRRWLEGVEVAAFTDTRLAQSAAKRVRAPRPTRAFPKILHRLETSP